MFIAAKVHILTYGLNNNQWQNIKYCNYGCVWGGRDSLGNVVIWHKKWHIRDGWVYKYMGKRGDIAGE